jgi:hypothetical protein
MVRLENDAYKTSLICVTIDLHILEDFLRTILLNLCVCFFTSKNSIKSAYFSFSGTTTSFNHQI